MKDENGLKKLPFYSINALKVDQVQPDSNTYKFRGQMVFRDIFSTLRKLVFIKGETPSNDALKEKEKLALPEWMATMGE
jgi:hypothetical protein